MTDHVIIDLPFPYICDVKQKKASGQEVCPRSIRIGTIKHRMPTLSDGDAPLAARWSCRIDPVTSSRDRDQTSTFEVREADGQFFARVCSIRRKVVDFEGIDTRVSAESLREGIGGSAGLSRKIAEMFEEYEMFGAFEKRELSRLSRFLAKPDPNAVDDPEGLLMATNRGQRQYVAERLAERLVVIDGEVWVKVGEPRWRFELAFTDAEMRARTEIVFGAAPGTNTPLPRFDGTLPAMRTFVSTVGLLEDELSAGHMETIDRFTSSFQGWTEHYPNPFGDLEVLRREAFQFQNRRDRMLQAGGFVVEMLRPAVGRFRPDQIAAWSLLREDVSSNGDEWTLQASARKLHECGAADGDTGHFSRIVREKLTEMIEMDLPAPTDERKIVAGPRS